MKHVNEFEWVDVDCLPVRADLRVVRMSDPNFGLTEDEVSDRYEFIRCFLLSEHESLLMVPRPEPATDFFIEDFQASAFNTYDFESQHPRDPFNKYTYRTKKFMEKVKDLAIMHSSISSADGRENTRKRYEDMVQNEFGGKLLWLAAQYRQAGYMERRFEIRKKVAAINRKILECKEIWERYAPPENWDP